MRISDRGSKKTSKSSRQRQGVVIAAAKRGSPGGLWGPWRYLSLRGGSVSGADVVQLRDRRDCARGGAARVHRTDRGEPDLAIDRRGSEVSSLERRAAALAVEPVELIRRGLEELECSPSSMVVVAPENLPSEQASEFVAVGLYPLPEIAARALNPAGGRICAGLSAMASQSGRNDRHPLD